MESIHVKVEACPGFNQIRMDSDGIRLLNKIQIIMLNVQEQRLSTINHSSNQILFLSSVPRQTVTGTILPMV